MKSKKKYSKFIIIILCLFIVSCTKTEKPENQDIKIESEQAESNTLVFGETREKKSSVLESTNENKGFSEIEKGDIKGQLLPIDSRKIIPEDMVIGKLLNFSSTDPAANSFYNAVLVFFKDLEKGVINNDVLHPSWKNSIDIIFTDSLSKRDFSIRVGEIINKAGIKSANIRLISSIGRSSGNVLGDNFEGNLLLSNVSIDLTQLDDVYLRDNMEFNPLSYSNLLLNY